MKQLMAILVAALALTFLVAFLLSDAARAQHDNILNEPLLAYAMCPTLKGTLAIVGAPNGQIGTILWDLYECAVTGPNSGVEVILHKIEEELVWAGDGLDDLMLVLEAYDRNDRQLWVWFIKAKFARQFPDRLRLLQPAAI